MSARLSYEKCPYCPEIRNTQGLKAHINKKHSKVATT